MKRTICLILLLCLLLTGCFMEKEYVFPEGAHIGGVNVGGMTIGVAEQVLNNAAVLYTLRVDLDGTVTTLTAANLGLCYTGGTPGPQLLNAKPQDVFSLNPTVDILSVIRGQKEDVPASFEPISYSEAEGAFVYGAEIPGTHYDYSGLAEKVLQAAKAMETQIIVKAVEQTVDADTAMEGVLEKANSLLNLEITYVFDCPLLSETEEYTLTRNDLAQLLEVQEDGITVLPSIAAVESFAENLGQQFSVDGEPGVQFLTATGRRVILEPSIGDCCVDTDALAQDLYTCILEGISGTRETAYLPEGNGFCERIDIGDTYVEVDIQNQMVYCFEDGVLQIQTPCVTGCVANGDETPTGIYYFYNMDRDCWLVGPTWEDWVDCWMAFYGGYGMHDANWREEFGGDIYLENGSHGCVNLPPEVAPEIYRIIDIGDAIILY